MYHVKKKKLHRARKPHGKEESHNQITQFTAECRQNSVLRKILLFSNNKKFLPISCSQTNEKMSMKLYCLFILLVTVVGSENTIFNILEALYYRQSNLEKVFFRKMLHLSPQVLVSIRDKKKK